jgi:hypothetical protein
MGLFAHPKTNFQWHQGDERFQAGKIAMLCSCRLSTYSTWIGS